MDRAIIIDDTHCWTWPVDQMQIHQLLSLQPYHRTCQQLPPYPATTEKTAVKLEDRLCWKLQTKQFPIILPNHRQAVFFSVYLVKSIQHREGIYNYIYFQNSRRCMRGSHSMTRESQTRELTQISLPCG